VPRAIQRLGVAEATTWTVEALRVGESSTADIRGARRRCCAPHRASCRQASLCHVSLGTRSTATTPVPVGSLADIVALAARATTADEVNRVFTEEAESERYRGVLGVTTDPFVSSDIIKGSRASVVDLGMTQVVDGDLIKVMSWYDNEWGYSSQLVREALRVAKQIEVLAAKGVVSEP
jgi:hypothetical protein